MTKYELLVLTDADTSKAKKISDKLKKIFHKIIRFEDWGVRTLSYKIKNKSNGHYYLFIMEADSKQLEALQYEYKINANFYRYLLLNLHKEFKNPDDYIDGKLKSTLTPEEQEIVDEFRKKIIAKRNKLIEQNKQKIKNDNNENDKTANANNDKKSDIENKELNKN